MDRCCIYDLARVGVTMHFQTVNQKPQSTNKMKEQYCQAKPANEVSIPDSWGLSELQRNFIDSMIDKKSATING